MKNIVEIQILKFLVYLYLVSFFAPLASGDDRHNAVAANVAVFLDLEGGQASLGQAAMNGFVLALQAADPGQNRKLFVSLIDTKTNPATTLSAANSVVSAISVASGFTDNDSVLVAGPIFEDEEVPFLSIGATDPSLPDTIGKSIFLVPFGDNAQAAAAAEFAQSEFGNTVAILWDATSQYSRTLPRYFRARFEELGGEVVFDSAYNGECDISLLGTQVQDLISTPSFIYLAGLPACIGETVASLRSAGVDLPIVGGDGLDTPNLFLGGAELTNDVWYTTHAWLSSETGTPEVQQFISSYEQAYGNPPQDAFAALGYDAANLLLDALQRTTDIRPIRITEALEETSEFQGVTGTITYSAERRVPDKNVWIVKVTQGESSLAQTMVPSGVPPPFLP
ncbi:MAG: amino acid ABC transporter substrate-binding protein [Nitrosomonas sp.]|nr:MAG: amino acid ABC transporter substrate-binding protein [Nitrosomonas sp.]